MSKDKQIEEMAWDLCDIPMHPSIHSCKECGGKHCHAQYYAERAYNAGYHKQNEGEWKYPPYAPFGGSYEMKRCSVCGYKPDFDSDNPYTKFCPNCGAKMKGGENNDNR